MGNHAGDTISERHVDFEIILTKLLCNRYFNQVLEAFQILHTEYENLPPPDYPVDIKV